MARLVTHAELLAGHHCSDLVAAAPRGRLPRFARLHVRPEVRSQCRTYLANGAPPVSTAAGGAVRLRCGTRNWTCRGKVPGARLSCRTTSPAAAVAVTRGSTRGPRDPGGAVEGVAGPQERKAVVRHVGCGACASTSPRFPGLGNVTSRAYRTRRIHRTAIASVVSASEGRRREAGSVRRGIPDSSSIV